MQIGIIGLRDHGSSKRIRLYTQAPRAIDGGEASKTTGSRSTPESASTTAGTGANETNYADYSSHTNTTTSTTNKRER